MENSQQRLFDIKEQLEVVKRNQQEQVSKPLQIRDVVKVLSPIYCGGETGVVKDQEGLVGYLVVCLLSNGAFTNSSNIH